MDELNINTNFNVTIYENLTPISPVLSKSRCRIFYKYENRNGTYITDEFADKLIKTLPYTPIKGIYDNEDKEFTGHGERRDEGRIYGIVPESHNFAWEAHLDEDGVERTYACTDVYLFTALYAEASQIPGKGESMELYRKSIKGDWQFVNGQKYYVFTDACFLGLQVLGESATPCFEGAEFYTLFTQLKQLVSELTDDKKYTLEETKDMKLNFNLSDSQKFDMLWALLNVDYNEENNWRIDFCICEVYDEYAIVRNYVEKTFERVYYEKNDETDSLSITKREKCYILDVNEAEYDALKAYRASHTDYSLINQELENLGSEKSDFECKLHESENQLATLKAEQDTINANYAIATSDLAAAKEQITQFTAQVNTLTAQLADLTAYKKNIVDEAKKSIISNYSADLSQEVLDKYLNDLDNYTEEQLDMNLTYELKKANPSIFSKNSQSDGYIPKPQQSFGINAILDHYKNKN